MVDECFSVWKETRAGVPQGSVLGPLLFLIFINDITDNIKSHLKLSADDTIIFTTVEDPVIAARTGACPGFLKGGGPISIGSLKKRSSDFKRGGSNGLKGGVQYICLTRTTNLAYLDAKE